MPILANHFGRVTEDRATPAQAFQRMRRHARNNNASSELVAEAIVAVGLQV